MTDQAVPRSARAIFHHRDFALFWSTRFFTTIAIQMQTVAIGWLIYALTGDPLDLGFVGLAEFVPAIGLALVTGHIADRFDRRLILMCCYGVEGVCALLLLGFAWSGMQIVWPIFLVIVLLGTGRAFSGPAGQALLPNLVPSALFGSAVAWSSSAWQVATIMGPALGGILFAAGPTVVFGVAAILLLGSFLLLFMMSAKPLARRAGRASWATILAGIRFIRSKPALLGAISLDLFAVLFGGATALLPIYARDILVVGPAGLGLLRSAPAVGAATMALILAHYPLSRRTGLAMFAGVGVFGLGTVIFGLSTSFYLSLGVLAVMGAADMISVFVRQTLVQIATPDEMRGRVAAVNSVFIGASNELGEFESGVTASWFGAVPAVVIGGIGTLIVALIWMRLFPALRRINRLLDEAPEKTP